MNASCKQLASALNAKDHSVKGAKGIRMKTSTEGISDKSRNNECAGQKTRVRDLCQNIQETDTPLSDIKIHYVGLDNQYSEVCQNAPDVPSPNKIQKRERPFTHKIYLCGFCNEKYGDKDVADITGKGVFSCKVCKDAFNTVMDLKRHLDSKRHHRKGFVKCIACGRSVVRRQIPDECKGFEDGPNGRKVCLTCKRSCTISSIYSHVKSHFGPAIYHCDVCYTSFSKYSDLKRHQQCHTGISNLEDTQHMTVNNDRETVEPLVQNKIITDSAIKSLIYIKDSKNGKNKTFIYCTICGRKVPLKHFETKHKLEKEDILNYVCDYCNTVLPQMDRSTENTSMKKENISI